MPTNRTEAVGIKGGLWASWWDIQSIQEPWRPDSQEGGDGLILQIDDLIFLFVKKKFKRNQVCAVYCANWDVIRYTDAADAV